MDSEDLCAIKIIKTGWVLCVYDLVQDFLFWGESNMSRRPVRLNLTHHLQAFARDFERVIDNGLRNR